MKSFDLYRHVPRDLSEATISGGIVSLVSLSVIFVLIVSEFIAFLRVETISSMFIDTPDHTIEHHINPNNLLEININISLPAYPCAVLSVDVQDQLGSHALNVGGTLRKFRLRSLSSQPVLDSRGNFVESPLHIDIESARSQRGEGCWLLGLLNVKKVPGNFHISAHAHPELLDSALKALQLSHGTLNVSHVIHHLSFGERETVDRLKSAFFDRQRVALSPLDGSRHIAHVDPKGSTSFEYYLKIVPTTLQTLSGEAEKTYQFTAAAHSVVGHFQLPAIFFRWDMSPITVQFEQRRRSFADFAAQLCAIVGGVFTVLGLLNAFIHTSVLQMKKSLGKLT